jgi:adenylate cyclase
LVRSLRTLASRRAFGLLLLTLLLPLRVWDPHALEELRLRSFDLYQVIRPRDSSVQPVVIVDIDERSINSLGQWPWPRTILADLLDRLNEAQVAAVGYDVVFPEPDRSSPDQAVRHFRELDETTRERLAHLPNHDEIFAAAIYRARVVLGQSGTEAPHTPLSNKSLTTGFAALGSDPRPYLVAFPYLLRNVPALERAAAGRGLFSIRTERDGMVRRVPLAMKADDNFVPALTMELLRVVTGSGVILIRTDEAGISSVAVPGLELPTDQNGRIWVYFAPHDKGRYVSAKDVIEGKIDPQRLAKKLVLIGTSAIGLVDLKTTPVHPAMPGVEVHAQLIEAALTNSLLSAPSSTLAVEMLASALIGTVLTVLAPVASVLTLFIVALIAAAGLIAGSWFLFVNHHLLFDATFPLLVICLVYGSMIVIGYFREQVERRRVRSAFAQYLSPTLVEQLASSPQRLVLGGEERILTILFSDVRGFTTIAETFKDDPHGLTTLMNRFLTPVTNAIIFRNGTIDKYMGDAVMAFWNAPLDDASQENNACQAALDMLECVDTLNRERAREASSVGNSYIPITIGIGINTGRCTVGNMGSDLRFQYTAMGDSVNLASRLEGQTKDYGVSIIIGSRTATRVAEKFTLLELDAIRVKGKKEAEIIYTVLGPADLASASEFDLVKDQWLKLLVCYRKQDWPGALTFIESCRIHSERFRLGGLIEMYERRIRRLQQHSPAADWDGVFTAETK